MSKVYTEPQHLPGRRKGETLGLTYEEVQRLEARKALAKVKDVELV